MKFKICLAFAGLALLGSTGYAQTTEFDINGLKVIFKHSDKYSVSAVMFFKGGTSNYTEAQQGIEDLALHAAAACGTKEMSKDQFRDLADKYSIGVGGSASYDYGSISLSCVKPYFNEGWHLFSQAILSPVFDEKELANTRQQLISGIRQKEGNPDAMLFRKGYDNAFAGSRYAYRPGGTAELMAKFSKEEVSNYYYKTLLNKNRMLLVVVGDLDINNLKQQLTASFGQLPGAPVQLPVPEETRFGQNNLIIENRPLATNYILGIMGGPAASDVKNSYANSLAYQILSEHLFEEIRTKRNLSYAPSASADGSFKPNSHIYVTTTKPKEAIEVMVNEVKRLRNNGFTPTDLRDAKAQFTTYYYMSKQSTAAMASMLGVAELKHSWKTGETMLQDLQAVQLKDVQKVFNTYSDGIRWTYLGNEEQADKAAFEKTVKTAPSAPDASKMKVTPKKD